MAHLRLSIVVVMLVRYNCKAREVTQPAIYDSDCYTVVSMMHAMYMFFIYLRNKVHLFMFIQLDRAETCRHDHWDLLISLHHVERIKFKDFFKDTLSHLICK